MVLFLLQLCLGSDVAEAGPLTTRCDLPENFFSLRALTVVEVPIAEAIAECRITQAVCALADLEPEVCRIKLAFIDANELVVITVLNQLEIIFDRRQRLTCFFVTSETS
jgi:hypothetical protein